MSLVESYGVYVIAFTYPAASSPSGLRQLLVFSAFISFPTPVPKRTFPPRRKVLLSGWGTPIFYSPFPPKERKQNKSRTKTPEEARPHVASWRRPSPGLSLAKARWGLPAPHHPSTSSLSPSSPSPSHSSSSSSLRGWIVTICLAKEGRHRFGCPFVAGGGLQLGRGPGRIRGEE